MITPALRLAIKNFPRQKNTLETLYRQNESFRSLCTDFRDCVNAVEYWCGSLPAKEISPALCEEYKILYAELKIQITKWLKKKKLRA